jgi:hypothetical protein
VRDVNVLSFERVCERRFEFVSGPEEESAADYQNEKYDKEKMFYKFHGSEIGK